MRIGMLVTPGTSGRQAEPKKLVMISVIASLQAFELRTFKVH
jgi:hypothetical protein